MTTNAIEECFYIEVLEEEEYNRFITIPYKDCMFIVVDPYIINIQDLKDMKPGKIVRVRRPGWGKGLIEKSIKVFGGNSWIESL